MIVLLMNLALAQSVTASQATLLPVDSVLVDQDAWSHQGGATAVRAGEGKWAWVQVEVDIAWPDDVSDWRLEDGDISLQLGDTRIAPIGIIEWGRLKVRGARASLRKPSEPYRRSWGWVFPIPESVDGPVLHIADNALPLTVLDPVDSPPTVAEHVQVEVVGVERIDHVDSPVRQGDWEGVQRLSATRGKLVAIDVNLQSRRSNKEGSGFFWTTDDLALCTDDQAVEPAGEWFGGKVATRVSHNPSVDTPPREPIRLFFITPRDLSRAELCFQGTPVAEVPLR